MLSGLFQSSLTCELEITAERGRKFATLGGEEVPVYSDGEDIAGVAHVAARGRAVEHQGVKVELVGRVCAPGARAHEFCSAARELAPPGTLAGARALPWKFASLAAEHESYEGRATVSYLVRLVVARPYGAATAVRPFAVQNVSPPPAVQNSLKMEVGLGDALHLEFEFQKARYHLSDVIVGKVYFLRCRLPVRQMLLALERSETSEGGVLGPAAPAIDTAASFEVMDGSPTDGQCIPVRMYLAPANLTPTYTNVLNKFTVQYFLNLTIIDTLDRKYFKKQEIILWRKKIG